MAVYAGENLENDRPVWRAVLLVLKAILRSAGVVYFIVFIVSFHDKIMNEYTFCFDCDNVICFPLDNLYCLELVCRSGGCGHRVWI